MVNAPSAFVPPMLAHDARQGLTSPRYASWVAQEKVDGIRAQLHVRDGRTTLFDRQGRDVTERFAEVAAVPLPDGLILDGELVAESGAFHDVLRRYGAARTSRRPPCRFLAFDLLARPGRSTWSLPLLDRLWALEQALEAVEGPIETVVTSTEIGGALDLWKAVLGWGGEGLVLKDPRSPYLPGKRSSSWLKFKARWSVVVTLRERAPERDGLAVRMELSGPTGPVSVGRVGTGWTDEQARRIRHALEAGRPLKAEVVCLGRGADGVLRSPVFRGLVAPSVPTPSGQLVDLPVY